MKESTSWYLFMFAGLIIFVLLCLHMIIMHLDQLLFALGVGDSDVLEFKSVVERGKQSFFMISYIVLLGTALYHGLYGLRTIIFELNVKKSLQKMLTAVLLISGIGLFIYGAYIAIAAARLV